jgi:hypothetical protein
MWVVVLSGRARGRVGSVSRRAWDDAGPASAVAVELYPDRGLVTPRRGELAAVADLVRRVEDATGAPYDWRIDD